MLYISYITLIIAFLIDIIFYIPLYIFFYFDSKRIYLYIYTFPIIKLDEVNNINRLKNMISIEKIKETKKEDLKIINSFNINKIICFIDFNILNKCSFILYPLTTINNLQNKVKLYNSTQNKIYISIKLTIVNILYELIKIRRIKSERKSN